MERKYDRVTVREDRHDVGNMRVNRHVRAEPDGVLMHELLWTRKDGATQHMSPDAYKMHGSADPGLDALDKHWERLQAELDEVHEQAAFYYFAKTGRSGDNASDEFCNTVLNLLSARLLGKTPDDTLPENGNVNEEFYPITVTSHRMDAMREACEGHGMSLDRFEKAIDNLGNRIYRASDMFDNVMSGEKFDGELEMTAGDNEYDDFAAGDDYDDDEDELDPHLSDAQQRALNTWEDEDYDPDDERDEHITDLMDEYIDYVVDFTNAANQLWMNALQNITDGVPVARNDEILNDMQDYMQEAQKAYNAWKESTRDLSIGALELRPVYELLEDPEKGPQARMQKIISMASRPKMLESVIKKELTRENEI